MGSSIDNDKSGIWLPSIVARNAREEPHGLFARVPKGTSYADGFQDVTKLQFATAIDHTANLIEGQYGKGANSETLAYIGPNDLRYLIVLVAGIKTGYKVFLPSPRNSKEAHFSLFSKLECKKLIVTEPPMPCVPSIVGELGVKTYILPSLGELVAAQDVKPYAYIRDSEDARNDPIFVLHTSGSTGLPKPLTYTNDFISRLVTAAVLPAPDGYKAINEYFRTGKFFITLPPFHLTGLAFCLIVSSYYGSVPVFALASTPPTTESFLEAINSTDVDWSFVPPVVIDDMGKSSELLEKLNGKSTHLFFTGGAVPKASGDVVAKRVPIWQVLGSSECASLPLVHALEAYDNAEDWQYVQPNPLLGLDMRHQYDDLHELVVTRRSDAESYLPVFTHFPDAKEFATKDLFRKHPSKPELWLYASRNDDLIVFLNGEKTNPITFEETVGGHPDVKAALVVGAQRFEAALLVELATPNTAPLSPADKKAIIESIWPIVQKANEVTPAHARVSKSKILLVDPAKPMLRAPKGTIQRNATLKIYADEIDQLYKQDDEVNGDADAGGEADVKAAIRNVVAELLGWDDLNFFQLGMDSLGVLRLQRALKRHLPSITLNTIYNNASVNALAKEIESASASNGEVEAKDPTAELAQLLESYQKKIDLIPASTVPAVPAGPATIMVTGTTGALGSYVVNRLLQLPESEVVRIYCFNRAKDAKARQVKNCAARGLSTDIPDGRVVFLDGDLAKPNFGLADEAAYNDLVNNVTLIIHNAWPVNFNLSLTSFVPSVDGVMGLINFAAASPRSPVIQFFSSISSVDRFPGNTVPEHVIPDLGTPELMGYGQSKYLSERLLDYATQHLGIKTISVRIGQVAGAARTATGWNRQEWLPSLVVSSAFISALPATIGDVLQGGGEEMINWVPMDYLADVLVELGLNTKPDVSSEANGVTIYQVTHPKPVSWSKLLPAIQTGLKESGVTSDLPVISYLDWYAQLKAKSAEAEESTDQSNAALLAHNNPAMKLIDFFWGVQYQGDAGLRMQLAMDKTLQVSPILRDMEQLKPEWVTGWTKDWMRAPWRGH